MLSKKKNNTTPGGAQRPGADIERQAANSTQEAARRVRPARCGPQGAAHRGITTRTNLSKKAKISIMSENLPNFTPRHVAIIMDGNGRWAKERLLPRQAGHNAGAKAVERTLQAAQKAGVEFLTLYAFSTENWIRPLEEIDGLMKLLEQTLDKYTKEAEKNNFRLWVSGEREPLPARVLEKIDYAVTATAKNTGLTLKLALNYGARQEITHAVNALIAEGKTSVTPEDLQKHLYHSALPDPELIIRTSGEERLSNFLLWQAAYSEFYFTPVLWPDFTEAEFNKALDAYRARTRRCGGL